MVMYHGSVEDFNTFDKNKIREVDYDVDVNGFWFTDEEYMAGPAMQTPNFVRGFFINAENPAHYKEVRRVYKETSEKLRNDGNLVDGARSAHDEVRMRLEDEGFDGVYVDSKPVVNEDELNKKGSTVVQRERSKVVLAKNEEGTLDMFTYSSDGEDHIGNFVTGFDDVQDFVDFASTTVVVFEPNQIKSGLNPCFNGNRSVSDEEFEVTLNVNQES